MLKGFKVISVYGNTSESTVTVTNKYFKFNADVRNDRRNARTARSNA